MAAGFLPLLLLGLLSGCAEYLPFGSGALEGESTPLPADLSVIDQAEIIQFETLQPDGSAYSVNLWIVAIDGYLHVFAGDNRTTWVENIENNVNVRLGVEGRIYELTAARITDAGTFETFARAWESKYGNRPRNENVDETYLFRLSRR